MTPPAETLIVNPQERMFAPEARARERVRPFAILASALVYLLVTAAVIYESRFAPPLIPQEEETPVEIVTLPPPEPPPPPPEEKKDEPKPQMQPPPDLSPAYDAPRAGTDEKVDSAADPDKSKPPPAAGAPEAQENAKAAPPPAPEAPPSPTPEPVAPPVPQAPEATETAPPPNPAAPAPAPPTETSAVARGKPIPMFASLDDVVGGALMKAPVAGGNSRATYTAILLGKILPQFRRLRASVPASRAHRGALGFGVDSSGRLTMRLISEESGSPELDRAAMEALARAGPFPPPPFRGDLRFTWTYGPDE